ncbi:MAG: transposase [Bacteroidota bacterium]
MAKSPKLVQKRRRYAEAFKKSIVQDFESGRYSVHQLARLHGICFQTIYNWIYKFSRTNQKVCLKPKYVDTKNLEMSTKKRQIRTKRRYSEGFRRARVKDFEDGIFSVHQMARLYDVSFQTLYKWIEKYASVPRRKAMIVEVPNSQTQKVKQLEQQLAEAQRLIGRLQIKNDHLETQLELALDEKDAASKKGSASKPSTGSSKPTKSEE